MEVSKVVFVAFTQQYIQNNGKLRLRAFQPSNTVYVRGVKGYFDLWHLQHASTYIVFDGIVGKLCVSAFQNFFGIENQLNIKKESYEQRYSRPFWASFDTLDI